MKKLNKEIKTDIHNSINKLIDEFLSFGLSLKDIFKFLKKKNKIKLILKNIKYIGYEHFNSDLEYENFVKNEIKDIIEDRNALDKDNITERHLITNYRVYEKIYDLEK